MGRAHQGEGTGRGGQLSCLLGAFVVSARLSARDRQDGWPACLPDPPRGWSPAVVAALSPPLILWGLFCAGMVIRSGVDSQEAVSAEGYAAALVPVRDDGRGGAADRDGPNDPLVPARSSCRPGSSCRALYVLIWMFNGKRSHSLIGVLATVCAFYISRLKRPSWPVLCQPPDLPASLVVAIAIGWRDNHRLRAVVHGIRSITSATSRSARSSRASTSAQTKTTRRTQSYETTEYGGFLLMMDTVPDKSGYDYGAELHPRLSTFIPRIIWPSKPLYGRASGSAPGSPARSWNATKTSPARRSESWGPLSSTAARSARWSCWHASPCCCARHTNISALYADVPWVQFWWSITFYNAWFMVVGDDPLAWFYYNWGFSTFPLVIVVMWWANQVLAPNAARAGVDNGPWRSI